MSRYKAKYLRDFGGPDYVNASHFWAKSSLDGNGCLIWGGWISSGGYGLYKAKGHTWQAHRVAFEITAGPIPHMYDVDHICRVRNCVNPAHLRAVTHKENILCGETVSAKNATKTHCANGHPLSGDNLARRSDGGRRCRECARLIDERRNATEKRKRQNAERSQTERVRQQKMAYAKAKRLSDPAWRESENAKARARNAKARVRRVTAA